MKSEKQIIQGLFRNLLKAPLNKFPEPRGKIDAPKARGVYVIYDSNRRVCHVGAAPRGKQGIVQRLANHLATQSSFTANYKPLKGRGRNLRGRYSFRCLAVVDPRQLVLLEAYAVGMLCPAHIGLHQLQA